MVTMSPDLARPWLEGLQQNAAAALSAYVLKQRWFRSKEKKIVDFEIQDFLLCEDKKKLYLLLMVQFNFEDHESEVYFIPFVSFLNELVDEENEGVIFFERKSLYYRLFDGFNDKDFEKWLFRQIDMASEITFDQGILKFHPRKKNLRMAELDHSEIHNLSAEQSNTSIVVRDDYILKIYRKLDAGINPEVEMLSFLSENKYNHVPLLAADITYVSKKKDISSSLGIMVDFIKSDSDGWGYVLAELQNVYSQLDLTNDQSDFQSHFNKVASDFLQNIFRVGQLTGELHKTLALDSCDARFSPEDITEKDVASWQKAYESFVDQVLAMIRRKSDLSSDLVARVQELLNQEERLKSAPSNLCSLLQLPVQKIRYHGDYHLGQILKGPNDWVLFDFEGEPLRSLEERKQKLCALKDVAGMLRSFSYAVHVSLRKWSDQHCSSKGVLSFFQGQVEELMRQKFLDGYFGVTITVMAPKPCFLIYERDQNERLLSFYELDKAIYELNYELNNRPDWSSIPLDGILQLLK